MRFACGLMIANIVSLIPSLPEVESFNMSLPISYSLELNDLNLGWSGAIPSLAKHSAITDFNRVLFFWDLEGFNVPQVSEFELTPEDSGLTSDELGGKTSVDLVFRLSVTLGNWAMFSDDLACLGSILTLELHEGKWDKLLLRSRVEALHFPLPLTDFSELLELVR